MDYVRRCQPEPGHMHALDGGKGVARNGGNGGFRAVSKMCAFIFDHCP